jgi:hypothetical protein
MGKIESIQKQSAALTGFDGGLPEALDFGLQPGKSRQMERTATVRRSELRRFIKWAEVETARGILAGWNRHGEENW